MKYRVPVLLYKNNYKKQSQRFAETIDQTNAAKCVPEIFYCSVLSLPVMIFF